MTGRNAGDLATFSPIRFGCGNWPAMKCLGRCVAVGLVLLVPIACTKPAPPPAPPQESIKDAPPTRSSTSAMVPPSPAKDETDGEEKLRAARALLKSENLGGVRLGMTGEEVIAVLGPPSKRHPTEHGSGEFFAVWRWKTHNVSLMFGSTSPKSLGTLRGLVLHGPSSLKTSRHIGIGSTVEELEAAYSTVHVKKPEHNGMYVIGVVYEDGLAFDIGSGKIDVIYWGADLGP